MSSKQNFNLNQLNTRRNRRMIKKLGWPGVLLVLVLVVITYFFSGKIQVQLMVPVNIHSENFMK